jgi:hypothetical protein
MPFTIFHILIIHIISFQSPSAMAKIPKRKCKSKSQGGLRQRTTNSSAAAVSAVAPPVDAGKAVTASDGSVPSISTIYVAAANEATAAAAVATDEEFVLQDTMAACRTSLLSLSATVVTAIATKTTNSSAAAAAAPTAAGPAVAPSARSVPSMSAAYVADINAAIAAPTGSAGTHGTSGAACTVHSKVAVLAATTAVAAVAIAATATATVAPPPLLKWPAKWVHFSLRFCLLLPWRPPGQYGASSCWMMVPSGFRGSPGHTTLGNAACIASTPPHGHQHGLRWRCIHSSPPPFLLGGMVQAWVGQKRLKSNI